MGHHVATRGHRATAPVERRSVLLAALSTPLLLALKRPNYGGTLRLRLPLGFNGLDPHVLDDLSVALFAPSVFDTLYSLDSRGRPYPALASSLPQSQAGGCRIDLRRDLRTARGKPLLAKDVVFALTRSRSMGGLAWLSPFSVPTTRASHAHSVFFQAAEAGSLAVALASPITAIVPRGFNRQQPDGTGAFRAQPGAQTLVLERNERAARGAAFLERVDIKQAADLSEGLRAFETGEVDVGWLGKGLHQPRADASSFNAGALGWVVLKTGANAGAWGAPGVAGQLASQLPPERLEHLGLRVPQPQTGTGWLGPSGDLLVDEACPQLVELSRIVASLLSRPGHTLTPAPRPRAWLRAVSSNKRYLLMLDFVRQLSAQPRGTVAALYTAADPALASRPPNLTSDARTVARTLTLGVLGELHAYGAYAASVVGLKRLDLADCWKRQV